MNLSAPFILRPVMTTLFTAAVALMGLWAFHRLPVSNLPDVNYPIITVSVSFPGANPQTMANTVATPLEKQFMAIPGIKSVVSSNTLSSSSIILEFEIDKDIDLAAVDVEAAITAAKAQLPPDLPRDPTYKKVNPSSTPIIYLSVTSPTLTQGELYDYANTVIGQHISIIEGVAQVLVYGSPKAVRIQVDPGYLATLNLTQSEVATAIGVQNQYLPLGQFDGNARAATLYDNGGLVEASSYRPIVVAYKNGSPLRLDDVSQVVDSLQNDRGIRRYLDEKTNQPSVTLAVQGQPGANAVNLAENVRKILPTLKSQLPASLDMIVVFDRSESILESIKDVELTLILAFILVVLVIFIYLGKVSETIIPSVVMPMSVIATFAIIYPLGYTIDNLSLLALTLAVGFIIDDAIVVLENIVRHVDEGMSPYEAALEGSKQIAFTIASMTLSLVAVFIPLIFMGGIIGKLFQEFAITLTIVTVVSGLISLTLTPMLCRYFIPPKKEEKPTWMERQSSRLNQWMLQSYTKALHWALSHRLFMLGIGLGSVLLSAHFFKILPTDFIPDDDIGFIQAFTEAEQGTSSDQMARYQEQIVQTLRGDPSIASLLSISSSPVYRQGMIFIALKPRSERQSIKELVQLFNEKVRTITGVNVFFKIIPLIDLNIGAQVRGAYQYLMQSLNPEELYRAAQTLFDKMRMDPTFQGISTDLEMKTPQVNVAIHRDHAASLGINPQLLEQSLLLGYSGNRISRIQTPIDQYDVILELNRDLQRDSSSLNAIYLRSSTTEQLVPFNAVSEWNEGIGPASINHFAQFPAVTITFNLAPNIPLSEGLERLQTLAQASFTGNVTGDVKGAAQTFKESMGSMGLLLVITVLAIYLVLGALYESYIHPLTILSTLPPAILGALLTLYLTGKPLSLYAYLGIILLVGIVKKNGIMMVDFALHNIRNKGETAENSIIEACIARFRPIMMTTVAAIMGALPIALGIGAGADSRRPLGFVIIGGMCVSQLITLFLTPVIYLYFEKLRERFSTKPKHTQKLG